MKRINLFELLVLVVFSNFSEATPPMLNACVTCSSPVEYSYPFTYDLAYFMRGQSTPTETLMYQDSHIHTIVYTDATKFDYILLASGGDEVFANTGRNTDVLFLFGSILKIRAKNNYDVSYSLNFRLRAQAGTVANHIISTDSAPYKKCKGGDAYKLDALYKRLIFGDLLHLGLNWCIFKIRKNNGTTFMMRRMAPNEEFRRVDCVFRSTEFSLTPLPDTRFRLELRISLGGVFQEPKYILETFTPDKIEEFFYAE